ncbi:MAG: hypothetical protein LH660_10550, partial [Phormidesmis sp. CAN_BIN36]|nr:hypothetical protein [Phormidesmis sp. CAN_BIN36]
ETRMNPNASTHKEPSSEPLNLFPDQARWQEWLRMEEECHGELGAGRNWGTQLGAVMQNPDGMEALAQWHDGMLREFRLLRIEWELGVATDAIYSRAHSRLMARFRQLLPELQEQLWRLFEQSPAARTDAFSADTSGANDARTQMRA